MRSNPLHLESDQGGILPGCCTVWLDQSPSPMVILDEPLIRRLDAAIDAIPADATGLVLASRSVRVFVAGADLKAVRDLSDHDLDTYLAYGQHVFGKLCALRCPTVAAINGAALGGGLELAMHCDGLVGAPHASGKPYPIGLPEAGLFICPGWGGTNLLPARMEARDAIERTAAGRPLNFNDAAALGLFDRVADSADILMDEAKRWLKGQRAGDAAARADSAEPLRWIGRPDCRDACASAIDSIATGETEAARAVFDGVRTGLDRGWQAALDVERRELVRLRSLPPAIEAIGAFFERSAPGKS